jgi:hypothetical protein
MAGQDDWTLRGLHIEVVTAAGCATDAPKRNDWFRSFLRLKASFGCVPVLTLSGSNRGGDRIAYTRTIYPTVDGIHIVGFVRTPLSR